MDLLPLPTDPRDGERLAQFCRLDCAGIPVLVINTHLTFLRNASPLRIQQLSTILSHLKPMPPNGPVFLCGDFNAGPDSNEIGFLLNYPAVSVQDTYRAGNGLPRQHDD